MQYMLLVYLDEKAWWARDPAEQERSMKQCAPHVEALRAEGKFLGGAPLQPTSTATTIKLQNGKRVVTDGPFAETREQLGGYTLIEVNNLDEAIQAAGSLLGNDSPSTIEIRPLVPVDWVPAYVEAGEAKHEMSRT